MSLDRNKIWEVYHSRNRFRKELEIPTICLVGPGGCGKDTVGNWVHRNTDLSFEGSCSWLLAPYIAQDLNLPTQQAYDERRENREFWRNWIDNIREGDPALVAAICLGESDVVSGARPLAELEASRSKGMIDLTIWIDNPRAPQDPTLEIRETDCDLTVCNSGTIPELHEKLKQLFLFYGKFRK